MQYQGVGQFYLSGAGDYKDYEGIAREIRFHSSAGSPAFASFCFGSLGLRVWGFGFRIFCLGCRAYGLRVWELDINVSGNGTGM